MNAVPFWVPTNTHIPLSFLCHQLATPIPFSPQTSTSFLNLHLHFSSLLSSSFHLLPIIYLHKHTHIYIYIYYLQLATPVVCPRPDLCWMLLLSPRYVLMIIILLQNSFNIQVLAFKLVYWVSNLLISFVCFLLFAAKKLLTK